MKPLNIVWIGGGDRAKTVIYPAFDDLRRQGKAAILGICHTNAGRREEFAGQYGLEKQYGAGGMYDYKKMIDELKPDAAVVIGQPNIMYDCWVWCLEQGLHLFIEKPLGLSLHQARALAALAERRRRITQVAFQRRYSPMIARLRDECLKRGSMTQVLCKFYKCEPADNFRARDHLMDDTVHAIDTLRWMAGSEISSVESRTARNGVSDINFIAAQLSFANGCVGHLLNNWSSGKRIFAVEMHAPGILWKPSTRERAICIPTGTLRRRFLTPLNPRGAKTFMYTPAFWPLPKILFTAAAKAGNRALLLAGPLTP